MNFKSNKRIRGFRLAAGGCALLLYAGACSPLGLGLAALLGSLDPNHQILIGRGELGSCLVLHHARAGVPHYHGVAARALTLFAQPANAANPDHVLQFSSADTLKGAARIFVPEPHSVYLLHFSHAADCFAHTSNPFTLGTSLPPPAQDCAPLCQRSAVLLI